MTRTLRDYQAEARDATYAEWAAGRLRTAVVMATGLGKTSVIGAVATDEVEAGGRVLVLAHRAELLDQITATCREFRSDIAVGRVQAGRDQRGFPITAAMTPTLANVKRRARMPAPSLVIYDEFHHAAAPTNRQILEWAGCYERTRLLGVTATLTRSDRFGMGDVCESVAFARDIPWAVEHGWLVRPRGRVVVTEHMDLGNTTVRAGDYAEGELAAMVEQDTDQIVTAWQTHASDRITVAFTPNVSSAFALAAEFVGAGVACEVVVGDTPAAERNAIFRRLAAGQTRVLVSVMVATEGWDCPPVSCVLMARPTRLAGLYQQMVGRGLRLSPDTGKTDCLVLDVVGASRGQRLAALIDLVPTVEYDTSELDDAPCDQCGEVPCICPPEVGERDSDGGRIKLLGPAKYEDLDLLLTASKHLWLMTYGGKPFLPAGDRMAVLWRMPDDTYRVGHVRTTGRGGLDGQLLGAGLDLDSARGLAESWAAQEAPVLATRGASWRRGGEPSAAQLDKARRLGIAGAELMNKARLSDEISIAIASRRIG